MPQTGPIYLKKRICNLSRSRITPDDDTCRTFFCVKREEHPKPSGQLSKSFRLSYYRNTNGTTIDQSPKSKTYPEDPVESTAILAFASASIATTQEMESCPVNTCP